MSFSTAVRTSRKGCTVALFQRICCFLFMRLAMISLTALSTNAVEIGSPCPTPGGVVHQRPLVALEVAQQFAGVVLQTPVARYAAY